MLSNKRLLTFDKCDPKDLCIPLQAVQSKTPKLILHHSGLELKQSAQLYSDSE